MIVDVFLILDDNPNVLKRPLLPYTPNACRIPLFANYAPKATGWPAEPWYSTENIVVTTILLGGNRVFYTAQTIPPVGLYTIHEEAEATYIVIGFEHDSLLMYERYEIVATNKPVYSMYGTKDLDGDPNPPMLKNIPDVKHKADALKHATFSLDTVNVSLIKDRQSIYIYGGEMSLSLLYKDIYGVQKNHGLGRYIINAIEHDMETANISGLDYRYLLNVNYPTETFTKEQYPFLQNNLVDKVKPDVIGIGNGVPGICLNGNQIYDPYPTELERYDFQFPPNWEDLIKIEAKMGDSWIEIYPGHGNPFYEDVYRPIHPVESAPIIDPETGIVKIWYSQALKDGKYGNDPNSVRMYAKWPCARMEDAIKKLLELSGNEDLVTSFSGEFDGLEEIGLYMDSSKPIFNWIELLQPSNILGGQLLLINDALNFRLENPNRQKKLDIKVSDVLNHEHLSVSVAEDYMYSGLDISYQKSYVEDDVGYVFSPSNRYPTADIYKGNDATVKFVRHAPRNEVFDTSALRRKVNILIDCMSSIRHKIENVELAISEEYFDLLIYDVVGYTPKVLDGDIEWIIYEKNINIKSNSISLTLVERIKTLNWNNGNP